MERNAYIEMASLEETHWWFVGRRNVLERVLETLRLPAGAKILELGSGTGGNFQLLSKFGHLTAMEQDSEAREMSGRHLENITLLSGELPFNTPFSDQQFDLICLLDVLEHIEDDLATLQLIHKLLGPDGRALITVPAYQFLYGPHDVSLHHKRRYEAKQLRERLAQAGLQPVMFNFMNSALLPVAWLARLLDKFQHRSEALGRKPPPAFLNKFLTHVFSVEAHLVGRVNIPFGLSIMTVVKRIAA